MALSIVLLDDRFPEGRFVLLLQSSPRRSKLSPHGRETLAACSPPITEIRAFGHIQTNRGPNARPHMPLPAPKEPPIITVNFGTLAQETRGPVCASPGNSHAVFLFDMNPEMFCRKSSGMPRWQHSSIKCAPFSDDSLKSMPLFATIPTG